MKSIFILLACAFMANAEMGEDESDDYRDGKNYNGLKYVFIDVSRYGALNEVFYDYDRYLNTAPGFNLRFGFSAGVGMTKFNENRQESRMSIDYGPTFRLHLDLSYLIRYD